VLRHEEAQHLQLVSLQVREVQSMCVWGGDRGGVEVCTCHWSIGAASVAGWIAVAESIGFRGPVLSRLFEDADARGFKAA
jgi:hypothetical protein